MYTNLSTFGRVLGACLELLWRFEQRTSSTGSLTIKFISACLVRGVELNLAPNQPIHTVLHSNLNTNSVHVLANLTNMKSFECKKTTPVELKDNTYIVHRILKIPLDTMCANLCPHHSA